MKQVALFLMCFLVVASCEKSDTSFHDIAQEISSGTIDKTQVDTIFHVASANSCDPVPTPGTWFIKQSYLTAYQHFYQIDAKPEYPGNVLCGPTSYMLGAHMIISAKGGNYPSTKAKLGAIYSKLKEAGKFDDAAGMYIGDLQWFCDHYDNPAVKTSYRRTSDRSLMKEYIEYNIKSGYPVVVTIQVYGTRNSFWDLHDADLYDQPNTLYYVSKNGPVGHFILLIGIKINADGSGTVWYKDPLSKTGTTQSASYTRILDAMKYNGNNDYYDAVGLFEGNESTSQQFSLLVC